MEGRQMSEGEGRKWRTCRRMVVHFTDCAPQTAVAYTNSNDQILQHWSHIDNLQRASRGCGQYTVSVAILVLFCAQVSDTDFERQYQFNI